MLYSDKDIVISDSITDDIQELVDFMDKYDIPQSLYTQYYNVDEPISEPFVSIKPTIYRDDILLDVTYITQRELLYIVGKKNESKEKQGYPRTKLLTLPYK